MCDKKTGTFWAYKVGSDSIPPCGVRVEAPTEIKNVRIGIYCAGTDTNRQSRDENQFRKEAEREVTWGLADIVKSGRTVDSFNNVLKDATNSGEKIKYLSIYSHVTLATLFLDNGEPTYPRPRYEAFSKSRIATELSYLARSGVKPEDVSIKDFGDFIDALKNKLLSNALVVFAGCNAGNTDDNEDNNIARYFTKQTGIASIGANNKTYPAFDNIRTVDGGKRGTYLLFYMDVYGYIQQHSLGNKLNKEAIENAIKIISDLQQRKYSVITQ